MAQAGALAALDDEKHLQQTAQSTQAGCRQLVSGLQTLGIETVPSAANFILVKTGAGREWFHALQRAKIIVRPMDAYGLPDYIRITVGTEQQNEITLSAIARIQNQFK
jgi:histidinol-phosphate aminotransferase